MNAHILLKDYCPAIAEKGGIAAADIIDLDLDSVDIKDGAVTEDKIADGAVTAEKLADGLVFDVGANSIESAMIQDGAVGSDQLANNAVIEGKIAANAVTADKIASNVISEGKLAFVPVKVIKGQVTYDGGASQTIATLPAGTLLLKALAVCDKAFDGDTPAPTLDIGVTGTPSGIIPTPDLTLNAFTGENPADLGSFLWDGSGNNPLIKFFGAEQEVIATCTFDPTISAGSLKVYLVVAQLDPITVP